MAERLVITRQRLACGARDGKPARTVGPGSRARNRSRYGGRPAAGANPGRARGMAAVRMLAFAPVVGTQAVDHIMG